VKTTDLRPGKASAPVSEPGDSEKLAEILKTCDRTLKKCDQALKDKAEEIKVKDEAIADLQKQVSDKDEGFFQKKELWFVIGLILGGLFGALRGN
jgi:peptidoglycan hydrolase CwlO-like protein